MFTHWLTELGRRDWSPVLWSGLWTGLVALIIGLSFLLWTRWGYYHLIGKCVLFSVLTHLVMGLFFATAEVVEAVAPYMPGGSSSPVMIEQVRIESGGDESGITAATNAASQTIDPVRDWDRPRNPLAISSPVLDPAARELPSPPPAQRPAPTPNAELPRETPKPELPVVDREPSQPRLTQATPHVDERTSILANPQQPVAQAAETPKAAVPESVAVRLPPQSSVASAAVPRRMSSPDPMPRHDALSAAIARSAPISSAGSLALPDLPVAAVLPARPVESSEQDEAKSTSPARPLVTPELIASSGAAKSSEYVSKLPEPSATLGAGFGPTAGAARESTPPSRANRSDGDELGFPTPRVATGAALPVPEPATKVSVRPIGSGNLAADRADTRLGTAEIYRNRMNPNRSDLAISRGGSRASEEAVERALQWFAAHQHLDGHWAGAGFMMLCPKNDPCTGPGRQNRDDCAVTGLALLAFLGGGHTHQSGSYAEPVSRAINWLLAQQKPNGDLRGTGGMYSQGIATLALSEALGMTGDPRLRDPVQRAVRFIVVAQHPTTGGWRYKPGDPGDTSIFGWQLMALKSAELTGVAIPDTAWRKARGWLSLVGSGRSRGLASYLPGEKPMPAMTAEALACREFLGAGASDPAVHEAAEYLMEYMPRGEFQNLYYWYYGTVAIFQLGGTHWEQWNEALRDLLISQQRLGGHGAGSWDPRGDPWGTEGGRVYTTALATLCLEVYYRYLPIQSIGPNEPREPVRIPPQPTGPSQ